MLANITFIIFTAVFSSQIAIGQALQNKVDIATIVNNGAGVNWTINVPYSGATLIISTPDGKVYEYKLAAGATPSFAPGNKTGNRFVDGNYTFELRVEPVLAPEVKEALAAARVRGNDAQTERNFKQLGLLPGPMIESGSFSVVNGVVLTAGSAQEEPEKSRSETASSAPAKEANSAVPSVPSDVVVPDDQIVQGSLCVGFDCVDGESFGFDTIRLKENNTRIKFEDTSTGAGFPSTDWQLTANDSVSGGANKFSIDDVTNAKTPFTVLANAPTNSIFVDSSGRLGLRTATPVLDIHALTGNTPAIRLDQSSAGGFTAQIWDIGANEANFFVRDVTGGSKLSFRIRPGAPTSSIDISATGNVGMGTASPVGPLHVKRGNENLLVVLENGNVGVGTDAPDMKLTVNGSVKSVSGGFVFPDGTVQTTAASTPGGSNPPPVLLGASYATHFIGAAGSIDPGSMANVATNTNTGAVGVKSGVAGSVVVRFNVPATPNLISTDGAFVVYKVRFRDSDGSGTAARVRLVLYGNDIETGTQILDRFFDSQTQTATGTGFTTVTVCRPADPTFFAFATRGMWIDAAISNFTTAGQADLAQIQLYKSATCP